MGPVLERWIAGFMAAPVEKRDALLLAVPKPEQTLTCPHCESVLSVGRDNATKVVVPGKRLLSEQTPLIAPQCALIDGEESPQENERRARALLLQILRSPKPGLPDAILQNLQQFADAAELYNAQNTGTSEAPRTPAGKGSLEDERRALDAARQLEEDNRRFRARIKELESQIQAAERKMDEGARGTTGRPRKRGKG